MGDIADDCTEAGEDAITAHISDECDMWCRYCDEEEEGEISPANPRNECARCGEESPEVYQDDSYSQICDQCAVRPND